MVIECERITHSTYELFPLISKNIVTRNLGNKNIQVLANTRGRYYFSFFQFLLLSIVYSSKGCKKHLKQADQFLHTTL